MYQNRDNYHQNYRHGHWFSGSAESYRHKVKIICFRPAIAYRRCGDLKSLSVCTAMNVNLIFENLTTIENLPL